MGRGEIDLAMVRMVGAEGKAGPSPWSVELRTDLVRYKMPQLDVFFCGKYGDPARAAKKLAILGSRRPFCRPNTRRTCSAYDNPKQLAKRVSISPPTQPLRGALSTVSASEGGLPSADHLTASWTSAK